MTVEGHSGRIGIGVYGMTSCLQKSANGELVDTTVRKISPTKNTCRGWEFDWTMTDNPRDRIMAIDGPAALALVQQYYGGGK